LLEPIRGKKGDAAVLTAGFHCSRLPSFSSALRMPATPLDWTSPQAASLWFFLARARDRVPAGTSYTVQARDPDDEMSLYMLSLGLLVEQKALPTSYFGVPTPEFGNRARFALVFGTARSRVGPGRLVCEIAGNAVYERLAS
jgi:hypothetical protein